MINFSSGSCHDSDATGKKSVVRMAQRVAALVPVQGLSSLLSNMYHLFDPSSTFVRFSVQNSGGWPVNHTSDEGL